MFATTSPLDAIYRQARAFEVGDFVLAAASMAEPTTVHVMGRRMYLDDRLVAAKTIETFYQNLAVEGFERTRLDVLHMDEDAEGNGQVLLRWTNLNNRGARINIMDVCCFCKKGLDDEWLIYLVEIMCEGARNLTVGLPLDAG
jgi:hypothetical protein